ncbi:MAG TPA: hypothetical protein DC049_18305, partial [Spirochaetia bacterium]|nr:hypothetical protein [Spirochaetia bacterium]
CIDITGLHSNTWQEYYIRFMDKLSHAQSSWSGPYSNCTLAGLPPVTTSTPQNAIVQTAEHIFSLGQVSNSNSYAQAWYNFSVAQEVKNKTEMTFWQNTTNSVMETRNVTADYFFHILTVNQAGYSHPGLNYRALGPFLLRFNIPPANIPFTADKRFIMADGIEKAQISSPVIINQLNQQPMKDGILFNIRLISGSNIIVNGQTLQENQFCQSGTSGGVLSFPIAARSPGTKKLQIVFSEITNYSWDFSYTFFPYVVLKNNSGSIYNSTFNLAAGSGLDIFFKQDKSGKVLIRIFDRSGKLISTVKETIYPEGYNKVTWQDTAGRLPAGMYFLVIEGEGWKSVRKIEAFR